MAPTLWESAAVAALIAAIEKAKWDGMQAETGWKPQTWAMVMTSMTERGYTRSAAQCKAQWSKLKGEYKIFKKLKNQSGFGFNPVTCAVTATATVWATYLAANPNAKIFKKKGFPLFQQIAAICDEVIATGDLILSTGIPIDNSQDTTLISDNSQPDHSVPGSSQATSDVASQGDKDEDDADETSLPLIIPYGKKRPRSRPSGAASLDKLVGQVGSLVESLRDEPSDSPAVKKQAFERVQREEGLSPHSLAAARKVFRGSGDISREYLSFASPEKEARTIWLQSEMDEITNSKSYTT